MCDNELLGFRSSSMVFASACYFICFTVLSAMVMMSLFIGIIATSMEAATQEQKAHKETEKQLADAKTALEAAKAKHKEPNNSVQAAAARRAARGIMAECMPRTVRHE